MKRIRFTIASLLVVVLLVAVGFAALRESSDLWDSGLFSVTLGILVTSILLAVHRHESQRAFWLGFALLGWGYLGPSLVPPIESRLITTKALAFLDSKVPGRSMGVYTVTLTATRHGIVCQSGSDDVRPQRGRQSTRRLQPRLGGLVEWWEKQLPRAWSGTTENFVRIGHSLLALVAAFLGGQLSRNLSARNREGTSRLSCPQTGIESDEHHSGTSR